MERSSPFISPDRSGCLSIQRRETMSRREYARRRGITAQLRRMLNTAAVVATCAAAALAGSMI
jgi:hypothetical protein